MKKSIPDSTIVKISDLLQAISPEPRLEILLTIGTGEACVCHLEAAMGWRQAYISQHLMALRSEGLVSSRRDGRNIYYRLKNAGVLDLIRNAAALAGIPDFETALGKIIEPLPDCICPNCSTTKYDTNPGKAPHQAEDQVTLDG